MRAAPGSGWRSTPTTRRRYSSHGGPATAWNNACPATAEPGPATTQTTTPGTTASSGYTQRQDLWIEDLPPAPGPSAPSVDSDRPHRARPMVAPACRLSYTYKYYVRGARHAD